jgi:hypothetical protein
MKIIRPKKVEIKLTVLIIISLILLTACGTQPTTEPTPISTVVLIQPASSLTPTSTPAGTLPPETPTPEARMTVEQQLAFNAAEKVPVFINGRGEVQFDWNKFYPDSSTIPEVDPANFATELEHWAAVFNKGLPPPDTTNPKDFTEVRWYTRRVEKQGETVTAINVVSDDYSNKYPWEDAVGAVKYTLDGEPYVAVYGRALLRDPAEIAKNSGNSYVTFWLHGSGHPFMTASNRPDEGDLKDILEGRAFIAFDTGIDREALITGSEPDTATSFLFRQKEAFDLLHFANLTDSNGNDIFVLDEPSFIRSVMAGHGFTADMQDKVFLGTISNATDYLAREFVESIPYPTPMP